MVWYRLTSFNISRLSYWQNPFWLVWKMMLFFQKQLGISSSQSGWWFGTCLIFPYIGNFIIPIDSYFSEGFKPPTRQCSAIQIGRTSSPRFKASGRNKQHMASFLHLGDFDQWITLMSNGLPSAKTYKKLWQIAIFAGKFTISTGPCSIANC